MTHPSGARPAVLVTGAAGFIGFHVARALLDAGTPVIGVDSMNAYYDPRLKEARLRELEGRAGFTFHAQDLADRDRTAALFAASRPRRVIHMAAQAGVRYSLVDPHAYMDANIVGFLNVLEGCRHNGVEHLVYASSSSVYGANTQDAVLGARQRRPSREPLRRQQEGQRADGAQLQPPLRAADHGLALLHGLRPVGTAGHGALHLHQGDPRRPADPGVQRRAACAATSPTSTTSWRACCARASACRHPTRSGTARTPTRAAARRPIGSTISATASRWT